MPRPTSFWITETLRHYDTLGKHCWLFLYLLMKADPATGYVSHSFAPISTELGISETTLKRWIDVLAEHGYLHDESWNHLLRVRIIGLVPASCSQPPVPEHSV
jgi:hypothetical protein